MTLQAIAQAGLGTRIAHDPGDPLITSHCPFCGSGQVIGRSDGTIECDFCGQNYIVRVQPAFPGTPQMPGAGGAPSDIGPDGGVLPPDAIGPDGLPVDPGMDPGADPGADPDADGDMPPFMDDGEGDEEAPPDDGEDQGEEDDAPPPPKSKKKSGLIRTYRTASGAVLTEDQFVRHLGAQLGGPQVLAQLRTEAADKAYNGHYNRGWKASQGYDHMKASPLERADSRGEPEAWYHGYNDAADDRPKFHSRDCPAKDHYSQECTLVQAEGAAGARS